MATVVSKESPDSPDALALIGELTAYLTPLSPPESQHGYDIQKLLERKVDFFVVRVDDMPAACGGIEFFSDEYAEVKRMYVRPQFRGQGLGRLLLDKLVAHANERKTPLLRLETGTYMIPAIKLYESYGFYRIKHFGEYWDDPLSTFFELKLPLQ
jgi:ribosomal protein S18 acetylase RimI-like enzyme